MISRISCHELGEIARNATEQILHLNPKFTMTMPEPTKPHLNHLFTMTNTETQRLHQGTTREATQPKISSTLTAPSSGYLYASTSLCCFTIRSHRGKQRLKTSRKNIYSRCEGGTFVTRR